MIRLVDINGNVAASYRYDPYGKATSALGSHANINPLRYRGYVFDHETGLYYLQSRYYDPEIGRFINADALVSTGQGLLGNNMFTYCHNNPILYVDPSGCIIVLASDATEEQIAEYERAIKYLKTSKTGERLISILESSQVVFTVVFVDDNEPRYDFNTNTIYFDINFGLILGDGISVTSPALSLAHEFGHAAQDLAGVIQTYNGDPNIIEPLNLMTTEHPIAKELGEPMREHYNDWTGCMDMQNSTHFVTPRPWWQYFLPWKWFAPRTIDHNV